MGDGIVTALIAALSALGGAAVAHWGAAHLQAQRLAREEARERVALLRQQRAACLGWVLEARTRIEALMPVLEGRELNAASADKTASVAARQAYSVALLYLAAARPSASAFYQSTAQLQLALDKPSEERVPEIVALLSSWQADYAALEDVLASMPDE